MRILKIVQSNTSTLDTVLPYLWYVKKNNPNYEVSILYCASNKDQVIRNSNYINEFCQKNKINQYDLSDFLSYNFTKPIWKWMFKNSPNDSFSLKKIFSKNFKITDFKYLGVSLRKKIEFFLHSDFFLNKNSLSNLINSNIVLFDVREKSRFVCRKIIFDSLYSFKPLTFLIPHAPHDITPYSELTTFDEKGEVFPEFCRYWISFKHSKSSDKYKNRTKDFFQFGYPAFDSLWMNSIKKVNSKNRKIERCLIMIRNFYEKNMPIPKGEFFTVSYKTNLELLNRIQLSAEKLDFDIEFIIKPHPKASKIRVDKLLLDSKLMNYEVSYEPFFKHSTNLDLVLSTFTTSLLITQFQGIPTIVVEDYVQEYVNKWKVLKELYEGLSLYVKPEDDLYKKIEQAVLNYNSKKDLAHLRTFFNDNSLNKISKNINNAYVEYSKK